LSGLSRFCENPCSALGGPLDVVAGADDGVDEAGEVETGRGAVGVGDAACAGGAAEIIAAKVNAAARCFTVPPR